MSISTAFHSPTHGELSEASVIEHIKTYLRGAADASYRLIIGTDSMPSVDGRVYLVSAVVLHRVGKGGIYFWRRTLTKTMHTLRERMYAEALASIGLAQRLQGYAELESTVAGSIEIHVDVGAFGPTREMIQELVGMIIAHGYEAKTKPESFAASTVADRHTIPGPKISLAPVFIRTT